MRLVHQEVVHGTATHVAVALVLAVAASGGCEQKMAQQPRYDALEASRLFANGTSAQDPVAGTVPRGAVWRDTKGTGNLAADEPATSEAANGENDTDPTYADRIPLAITGKLMQRGQERYTIYCQPCHGASGDGRGPVVRHGFPVARSLHSAELRERPVGFFYEAITNGPGKMPSYAALIPSDDRWAIVAYVRALQFSQHASLDDLPEEIRAAGGWDKAPESSTAR